MKHMVPQQTSLFKSILTELGYLMEMELEVVNCKFKSEIECDTQKKYNPMYPTGFD